MSELLLKEKLDAFIKHRANAARIAKERGGEFVYAKDHPHDLLDATEPLVREYFFEINASITALHEGNVLSGAKKPDEKPALLEPHICECCQKLVIPVPADIKAGQPFGSIQFVSPINGRARREAIYDIEKVSQ